MATNEAPFRIGNPALDDHFAAAGTVGHRGPAAGHLVVKNWPGPRVTGMKLVSSTIVDVEAERVPGASKT
jgi:hypothetical protein